MNAFEKIKERLEENQEITFYFDGRPPKQVISYDTAIEIVNQVAEEYSSTTNDGWISLPKEAFDRMIARMESESERDIYEEESLFINVRDAARIVHEIVKEHSDSEIPNKSDDDWIPANNKPKEKGEYLCIIETPYGLQRQIIQFDKKHGFWSECIYWMPLPKICLPKGEK